MLRRFAVGGAAAFPASSWLAGCATPLTRRLGRVVIVGGGYGGATMAGELKAAAGERLEVWLVEPRTRYVATPLAARSLVQAGSPALLANTVSWHGLRRRGVGVVEDAVTRIDPQRRLVELARGQRLEWDRLVLATGAHPRFGEIAGWSGPAGQAAAPPLLRPGPAWLQFDERLRALPARGTIVLGIARAPVSGPWSGYERASLLAGWLARERPQGRLVVLDGNAGAPADGPDFPAFWQAHYERWLEYHPANSVVALDPRGRRVTTEFNDVVRGDLIDLLPAMDAGPLARTTGLLAEREQWCAVAGPLAESSRVAGIHLLGDVAESPTLPAAQRAAARKLEVMPKTAGVAQAHAVWLAAGLLAWLDGRSLPALQFEASSLTGIDEAGGWQLRQRFVRDSAAAPWRSETVVAGAVSDRMLRQSVANGLVQTWGREPARHGFPGRNPV